MDLITGSETKRNQAADRLAEMEVGLSEADATLRRTEAALGESREARVRTEAQVKQAKSDCDVVAERISERLDSKPETPWPTRKSIPKKSCRRVTSSKSNWNALFANAIIWVR